MAAILLITGGSGYLGRHLARQARDTWQVAATYFANPASLPACRVMRLDIRDEKAVVHLLTGLKPSAVIHTAADMDSPQSMQEVIIDGTRHVAAAAAAVGARLIHLSTDALFDGESGSYRESDPPSPITLYGQAKAAAERAVFDLHPRATIVRTSLIYGFDPPDPRTRWVVDSVRDGRPITLFTDEMRSPVWVEQLAAALLEVARRKKNGMWHIAGPRPLSRYDFGVQLAHAYGLDPACITPGLSRAGGQVRPRDCTLDVTLALAQLRSPLWSVDEVLAHLGPQVQAWASKPGGPA